MPPSIRRPWTIPNETDDGPARRRLDNELEQWRKLGQGARQPGVRTEPDRAAEQRELAEGFAPDVFEATGLQEAAFRRPEDVQAGLRDVGARRAVEFGEAFQSLSSQEQAKVRAISTELNRLGITPADLTRFAQQNQPAIRAPGLPESELPLREKLLLRKGGEGRLSDEEERALIARLPEAERGQYVVGRIRDVVGKDVPEPVPEEERAAAAEERDVQRLLSLRNPQAEEQRQFQKALAYADTLHAQGRLSDEEFQKANEGDFSSIIGTIVDQAVADSAGGPPPPGAWEAFQLHKRQTEQRQELAPVGDPFGLSTGFLGEGLVKGLEAAGVDDPKIHAAVRLGAPLVAAVASGGTAATRLPSSVRPLSAAFEAGPIQFGRVQPKGALPATVRGAPVEDLTNVRALDDVPATLPERVPERLPPGRGDIPFPPEEGLQAARTARLSAIEESALREAATDTDVVARADIEDARRTLGLAEDNPGAISSGEFSQLSRRFGDEFRLADNVRVFDERGLEETLLLPDGRTPESPSRLALGQEALPPAGTIENQMAEARVIIEESDIHLRQRNLTPEVRQDTRNVRAAAKARLTILEEVQGSADPAQALDDIEAQFLSGERRELRPTTTERVTTEAFGEQTTRRRVTSPRRTQLEQEAEARLGPERFEEIRKDFDLRDALRGREIAGGAGPPPQSPTGAALPELGVDGAERALNLKSETLRRNGALTQLPGIRQTLGKLQPAANMDRKLLVSYNSRGAVEADLVTAFSAKRLPLIEAIERELAANPPTYVGPKSSATDYLIGTPKSIFENPEHYTGITPALRSAIKAYDDAGVEIIGRVRAEYGVDLRPFSVEKPGWTYLATSESREALEETLEKVGTTLTSSNLSRKASVTKTRLYETAFDRSTRNPRFKAETDLRELSDLHDRALARLAGNETFRMGVDGKTRLQVMQETHPQLAERMLGLRTRLQSLRGTAGRLNERLGAAVDDFLTAPDGSLSDVADALDVRIRRGPRTGANIKTINAEIKSVRMNIRELRPAWEGANLDPFVLNRKTFRYHTPEQSEAIDRLLLTKLPIGEGMLQAIDEVRLTAFAADLSPVPIQIGLGTLADPLAAARAFTRSVRTRFDPDELLRIAREEPDKVSRFTQATQRPFGIVSGEFAQAGRGLERLPLGRELNDRLFSGVELARYRLWEAGTDFLQKRGGKPLNIADSEAANAGSKIIPGIVSAESGRSVLRAKLERVPVISTSFILSPAGAVKDATSGLFKLGTSRALSPAARWQNLAGREQLAIKYMVTMAGTITSLSIGSHVLSGWSPEEAAKAVLDPDNPRFISIALGKKRRIAIGGPFRSALKAFIPRKVGEVDGQPIYLPFAGTKKWLQGKITPAISGSVDLARNADYFGRPISTGEFPENLLRSIWFGANQVLPLTISDPSEAVRTGEVEPTDIGRLGELGGAQFLGTDLRETSPRERFNQLYQERFGEEPPPDISPRTLNPELAREAGFSETTEFREERTQITSGEEGRLADLAQIVLRGNPDAMEQFGDELGDFFRFRSGVTETLVRELNLPEREASLVQEYYDLDPRDRRDPETGDPDWEHFNNEQQRILQQLRRDGFPQAATALERGTGIQFSDPDLQRVYDARQELRDGLDRYYDTDSKRREDFRRRNPDIDAKLYLLGRVSRVVTRTAQTQVRTLSRRLLGTEVEASRGAGREFGDPITIRPLEPIGLR